MKVRLNAVDIIFFSLKIFSTRVLGMDCFTGGMGVQNGGNDFTNQNIYGTGNINAGTNADANYVDNDLRSVGLNNAGYGGAGGSSPYGGSPSSPGYPIEGGNPNIYSGMNGMAGGALQGQYGSTDNGLAAGSGPGMYSSYPFTNNGMTNQGLPYGNGEGTGMGISDGGMPSSYVAVVSASTVR